MNMVELPWRRPAGKPLRIGLVNPPSAFLLDERVFASLGLLKIASVLEAAGHRVEVLDLSGIENYTEVVEDYLAVAEIDAIGITATTPQLPSVMRVARTIRERRPALRQILGGPHVTLAYAALKAENKRAVIGGRAARAVDKLEEMFDVLVAGDGEFAVFEAIGPNPPKMIDGDDHNGKNFLSHATYEDSPLPARHLIDLASYKYTIEGRPSTSLIAQLGCPFGCGFCGGRSSKALRVIRTRSSDSIVREVEFLYKTYGYTGFMFYDDELNVNPKIVELMNKLCDLQSRLGVDFRLRGFVKSELFTDEQGEAMKRAGFSWLLCGYEAAHPRILTNIDKRATLEDNTRAVEIGKKHGLKVKGLMSIGHPGESEDTIRAIHDWLIACQVDDFDCTIITPYPGTPYHDMAVPHDSLPGVWTYTHRKTGDRLHAREVDYTVTADYYKGIPGGGYQAFVFTDHLSGERLVEMRDWLEDDVRKALGIPFNAGRAALRFDHSMGQGLPDFILRGSAKPVVPA
ncbi:MAG: B12-binding domain-containing radical SAM protein [Alphaproteobacteria bacterium]|nr:B12-binding domain-containing radical SAM protein [Alphaproteobacteria bacterium]